MRTRWLVGIAVGSLVVLLSPFQLSLEAIAGGGGEQYGARWTAPQAMAPGDLQEYPDVTVDARGGAWTCWIGMEQGIEHVYVRSYRGQTAGPVIDVGLERGLHYAPRVLAAGEQLWVVWSMRQGGMPVSRDPWQLVGRVLENGTPGALRVLSGPHEDALRPVLGLDSSGKPWVAWESRVGKRFRILASPLSERARSEGAPLEPSGTAPIPASPQSPARQESLWSRLSSFSTPTGAPSSPSTTLEPSAESALEPAHPPVFEVAVDAELNLRPALTAAPEGGIYVVWDQYAAGEYQIYARRLDGRVHAPIRISNEPAANIGPTAVTDAAGRIFIAYATNADGHGGQRVGKELRVKALHEGIVRDLAGGQPQRIGTAPGRLDAVEFPTTALDGEGRLWVFARRGQGWMVYFYEGAKWHAPVDLSEKGWGGRGREMRAAWSPDGFHLVARRLHLLAHQLLLPVGPKPRQLLIEPPPRETALVSTARSAAERGQTGGSTHAVKANAPSGTAGSQAPPEPGGVLVSKGASLPQPAEAPTGSSASTATLSGSPAPGPSSPANGTQVSSSGVRGTGSSSGTRGSSNGGTKGSSSSGAKGGSSSGAKGSAAKKDPTAQLLVLADGVGAPRPTLASAQYAGSRAPDESPLVRGENRGYYFGDLHTHTWFSDGAGDPDEVYTRSRDRYHYDFVAVTDHDLENGNILLPSEWEYLKVMSELFNAPGRFATFVAYEWTSLAYPKGAGHKNVYFPGDDGPLFSSGGEAPDSRSLFDLLRDQGAMAVPHHIGWTGTDWANHDPEVQRAVEVVSLHGAFEKPGNRPVPARHELAGMFIRDGLLRGLKFGLMGGSDGHGFPWHYGVSRKEDIWRTGMTGLQAPTLNRQSLHAALMNRQSIATSGAPIGVWFSVNGEPMGSELEIDRGPRLDIRVEGTAPLQEVVLIRDGEDIRKLPGEGNSLEASLYDDPSPGNHFYYLRAVQGNGEVAWSSPVWVDLKGRILVGPPDP